MADPNRKINLDLQASSDEEEEEECSSIEEEIPLDPAEVSLVKEFEEAFKDRFTDNDTVFTEFCKQKPKPPPIVFPFESFNHHRGGGNHRRGEGRGGRGGFRQNYDNNQRYNNHQNYNRNREHQPYKRSRNEDDT